MSFQASNLTNICFFWDSPATARRSQHTCRAKWHQSIRCKNAMAYAESQLHLGHFWTRLRSASSRCQGHYGPKSQDLPSSTDCNRMHSPNHHRCNSWSKLRGQSWTGSSWSGPKPQALCRKHCVTKVTPKQHQIQTTSSHHVVTSDLRNVNLWYLCSRIQTNIKLRRSQTHDRIDSPIWPSSFNFSIFSESLNWPQSKSAKTLTLQQPMAHTSLSQKCWTWAIHRPSMDTYGYPVIKIAIKWLSKPGPDFETPDVFGRDTAKPLFESNLSESFSTVSVRWQHHRKSRR